MRYLQLKTTAGLETIDELNPKDFPTFREFRKELARLIGEYRLCMTGVLYWSRRPCKHWLNR